MKKPTFSIITPSYNQAQFIEETIKSVVEQDYPNLEYIIIDGGSTDGSVEIIKRYAKRYPKIIKWVSEKDKGQSDAINKGLRMSTGEILCYLNSDDLFEKGALFEVAKFFKKHPDAYWLTGDYRIIDEKGKEIHSFIRLYKKFWIKFPFREKIVKIINFINQPSTFWRREVYKRVGEFSLKYKYNMDYDYWLRILKAGYKLFYLDAPLSKFRVHSQSKGGSEYKKQFQEDIQVLRDNNIDTPSILLHKFHNVFILFIYSLIK